MKRVLFINHTNAMHGAETIMFEVMRARKKSGDTIFIVTPTAKESFLDTYIQHIKPERWISLPYKMLGKNVLRSFFILLGYNLYACLRLIFFVKKNKIDIIYSNTSVNCIGALVAQLTKKKHIWHFHEPIDKSYGWTNSLKHIYDMLLNKKTTIVFICKKQKNQWLQKIKNTAKSIVVYNPIKTLENNNINKKNTEELVFGYIGNINQRKNITSLIQAFIQLSEKESTKQIKLKIAGIATDAENKKIQELIDKSTVKNRIDMMGYTHDVSSFYSQIDVLTLVSYSEMMPLVVLEAMSMKKAAIVTTESGLNELLEKDKDCLFVNPSNKQEICNAMELMLNDSFRTTMQECGYNKINNIQFNKTFENSFTTLFENE
jgi:glycosyltransferase involved in cell wall biosynthesis